MIQRIVMAALSAALLSSQAGPVSAQAYPTKPISLYLGLPAGGSTDFATRVFAERAGRTLDQRFLVENKVGASGVLAANALKTAKPDGYTLMIALGGAHTITPHMRKMPFDPLADFTPIAKLFSFPSFLAVPANSPANSVADLVALARSNPKGLFYGSQGTGSPQRLMGILFQEAISVPLTNVAYRGGPDMINDLIGAQIDMAFVSYSSAKSHIIDKRMKILAIAAPERWDGMPEVPTLAEAGYPSVAIDSVFGLMGPPGLSAPLVKTLQDAFKSAAGDSAVASRLAEQGFVVRFGDGSDLMSFLKADSERLAPLIARYGLKED